jgi:hypothetical protein
VLKISKPDQPIPFAAWVAYLRERRAAHPDLIVPRNAGNRRTASKKALLKAIEDAGGKW